MNEVKLLNIGGIDQNVKDQYARDIIAPSENGLDSTSNLPVASRHYDAGEFLIGQDRLFYEALDDIEIGDTLVANVNIKATTVSDELVSLRNKSADAAIECIAPMEKTGLSSAEYKVGEYLYWDYGTNAGLYKAKILINIGDALIVDTNIEAAEPIAKSLVGLRKEFTQVNNDFGVKNLLPNNAVSKEVNGVTFTVNSDGSITINGTSTAVSSYVLYSSENISDLEVGKSYILSGGGSSTNSVCQLRLGIDAKLVAYSTKNHDEHEFTMPSVASNVSISILINASGIELDNVTFKPMIRPAYITDDTYEPYARSNQELTGEVEPMLNVLGAKNLLHNTASTQLINSITYTVNSDGSVKVNGTASPGHSYLELGSFDLLPNIDYILSGCPSGGAQETYTLYCTNYDASKIYFDAGNGVRFNSGSDTKYTVYIRIRKDTTVSNLVFKPMIRPASIKDDTYVPYAMTNRELTESRKILNSYSGVVGCPSTTGIMVLRSYAIPENGTYLIIGWVIYTYESTTEVCLASISKNDAEINTNRVPMNGGGGATGIVIEPCSKGDILKLVTYAFAGHTGKNIKFRFTVYKLF